MADAMSISSQQYHHILRENSSNNLRLEHLEALLASRKVNPLWIMTGQGEKYLDLPGHPPQEFVAGDIVPGPPVAQQLDGELIDYLATSIMRQSQLPLLSSDLAYAVLVDFGRQYMSRNPGATRQSLDIPALTAAFLALLQTAQHLIQLGFESSGEDTIVVRFAGQTYNFVRHPQLGK
jgi:hypothetical protein